MGLMSIDDHNLFMELLNESADSITRNEHFIKFLLDQKLNRWNSSEFTFSMCIFYATIFCFGIFGNIWVICVVAYILKALRGVLRNPNVFIYIIFLSIVDSMVLFNLPMLTTTMYMFQWIFGHHLCKIYWIVESTNKTLSAMILAAMSCDRYLAVCHPMLNCRMRSARGTLYIVVILVVVVVVLLTPVYLYANIYPVPESLMVNNITIELKIPACNLVMDPDLMSTFTGYLCMVGFVAPSSLIIFFYSRILLKLYTHNKSFQRKSQIPVRRVTCAIFMLVIFYFVCWTPYWGITLYSVVAPHDAIDIYEVELMHILHSLVYVNSSFNWVLYAVLNKNLRECRLLALKRNRQFKSSQTSAQEESSKKNIISKSKLLNVASDCWV